MRNEKVIELYRQIIELRNDRARKCIAALRNGDVLEGVKHRTAMQAHNETIEAFIRQFDYIRNLWREDAQGEY